MVPMRTPKSFFAATLLLVSACVSVSRPDGDVIRLETSEASCEVALSGARILSFKVRGKEVLWAPTEWRLEGENWAHGGIPLCWPWFGRSGPSGSGMHGFAYRSRFYVRRLARNRSCSEVVLGLRSSPETLALWPHEFDLEYSIALEGDALRLRLRTVNESKTVATLTDGYHAYFKVGERDRARVSGTDGCAWCDSRKTMEISGAYPGDFPLTDACDHVFTVRGFEYALIDPSLSRKVLIGSRGNKKLVVWNPGPDDVATPGPGALGPDSWRHMVTVEPATLWRDQAWLVPPGGEHALEMTIRLEK